ncbi:right-handed parallel beta-helix repeat-containing protein [Planctomycetota bacterium]
MKTAFKIGLTTLVCLVGMACATFGGQIKYVDAGASPGGSGASWVSPYKYLQDALAVVSSGDEIWVAEGTYKPDQGGSVTPGDRTETFQLKNGVAIYGGFPSGGGAWESRDPNTYKSTLSGDLNSNDGPDFANYGENSYHVVTGSGTNTTAVLDGFTISRGNGNGGFSTGDCGGGMYNSGGSPTMINCTFNENVVSSEGGGIYNDFSSNPNLTQCRFVGNSANGDGGGMCNTNSSSPTLTNCTFQANSSTSWGGGGMYNYDNCNPTLISCTFNENFALNGGGGIYNFHNITTLTDCTFTDNWTTNNRGGGIYNYECSSTLTNCVFNTNSTTNHDGGGMNNRSCSNLTLINCTFSNNSTDRDGGGMYNYDCNLILTDCTFSGNSAFNRYGGGMDNNYCSMKLTNCTFSSNFAGEEGGGIHNYGSTTDSTLTNCTFNENSAGNDGGGMYNYDSGSGPMLVCCTFSENSAGRDGGGICNYWSSPIITNCAFNGNLADNQGGGVFNHSYSSPALTNCLFSGNAANSNGGGMFNKESSATLTNCTLSGNSAGYGGGIYCRDASSLVASNCILWGNTGTGAQIYAIYNSTAAVNYSCIQGDWAGAGNIVLNPLFIRNPYHGGDGWGVGDNDDFGNLRLSDGSPCIDAADNTSVPSDTVDLDGDNDTTEPTPFDLDYNPRFYDDIATLDTGVGTPPIVDMGAYEFQGIPGDFEPDGDVDFIDFAFFADYWMDDNCGSSNNCEGADLNQFGTVDFNDLFIFTRNWLTGTM